jgi:hypothetical protein
LKADNIAASNGSGGRTAKMQSRGVGLEDKLDTSVDVSTYSLASLNITGNNKHADSCHSAATLEESGSKMEGALSPFPLLTRIV